ncbi:MAG TPA: 30S ribosomal protein S12 methylthiotransferase RimO [bacterium]|nr:30S ribosomal protein S12 methylthiotransferase RimO [bacterium]
MPPKKKYYIITLGCPKNDVESDAIRKQLFGRLIETEKIAIADYIIVNTCAFIQPAINQSDEVIKKILQTKKTKQTVVVTGCYINRNKEMLIDKFQDKIIIAPLNDIAYHLLSFRNQNENFIYRTNKEKLDYAYIKISDGCNKKCGYCTIPKIKGRYVSRSIDSILAETEYLLKRKIKELIIVSQDTCYYGKDIKIKYGLIELLKKMLEFKFDYRIRLMYLNPDGITKSLIKFISDNEKICKYIDMPIQHTETEILKAMRRPYNKNKIIELVDFIRKYNPNIALRSAVIVGYPNETQKIFKRMLETLKILRFDKLGCFKYSDEVDTYSYNLNGKISDALKEKRFDLVMKQQQNISRAQNKKYIGTIQKILIDGYDEKNKLYLARNEYNAPEIDGYILFKTKKNIDLNKFYNIKIIQSFDYDLFGELI